jgi:hypothetical protein
MIKNLFFISSFLLCLSANAQTFASREQLFAHYHLVDSMMERIDVQFHYSVEASSGKIVDNEIKLFEPLFPKVKSKSKTSVLPVYLIGKEDLGDDLFWLHTCDAYGSKVYDNCKYSNGTDFHTKGHPSPKLIDSLPFQRIQTTFVQECYIPYGYGKCDFTPFYDNEKYLLFDAKTNTILRETTSKPHNLTFDYGKYPFLPNERLPYFQITTNKGQELINRKGERINSLSGYISKVYPIFEKKGTKYTINDWVLPIFTEKNYTLYTLKGEKIAELPNSNYELMNENVLFYSNGIMNYSLNIKSKKIVHQQRNPRIHLSYYYAHSNEFMVYEYDNYNYNHKNPNNRDAPIDRTPVIVDKVGNPITNKPMKTPFLEVSDEIAKDVVLRTAINEKGQKTNGFYSKSTGKPLIYGFNYLPNTQKDGFVRIERDGKQQIFKIIYDQNIAFGVELWHTSSTLSSTK